MIQLLADKFRAWRQGINQDAAQRYLKRRDFWRWEHGQPWHNLIPSAAPWAVLIALWGLGLMAALR